MSATEYKKYHEKTKGMSKEEKKAYTKIAREKGQKKAAEELEKYRSSLPGEISRTALRQATAIPGNIVDFPALFYTVPASLSGKETTSLGHESKKWVDRQLGMEGRPIPDYMKLAEAGADVVGGGVASKILKYINAGDKASKITKIAEKVYKPTKAGVVGNVAAQHVLNVDPENHFGAFMTGVGLPLMLGKTGTMLKNRSHQTAIKHAQKNANLRQTAIENIGKQAGSDQIKLMNRVESGKVATKAMQQNKAKADTRFEKRFSKAEQEARKITEDFTNPKSNINVGHSVQDLLDKVKWKYLSDDDRALFLSTEPGKAIKRLLDLKGHRNPVHKINRLIEDGNLASKKAKYHSVEDVSKQLRNFTSKGETIGTVHEGLARNLNTNLIDNMGTVFEGNPKMHKYWKDTRAMYSVESQHKKPLKNAVLEHQPRKFFEGKPTEAFLETVKGEGSALQSPHHLDYIMQGLNPEEKNKYIQGLLHELGTKSGDFNFPHAAEGYGKLKEPIRNILENSMNPETQEKFARGNKLLTAHDYEMAQPIKSWGFAKKKIPDITNPYAKTDAKSVDKYIRALESKAGVSSSLGKPPLNAESFLGSTQEAIHSPAIIAKTSLFKEQEPPEDIMPQEVTNEPDWDNMSTEELRAIADEPDWDSLSTEQLREIANS